MRILVRLGLIAWVSFAAAQSGENGAVSTNTTESPITSSVPVPSSSISPSGASSISKPSNATCLSRTANYITHRLPQQCLRTDRVAANATRTPGSNDTSTSNGLSAGSGAGMSITATPFLSSETAREHREENDQAVPASSTSSPIGSGSVETVLLAPTDTAIESSTTLSGEVGESDSPLDNANFLSFEEWKRQNQAKAEQAAEQPFVGDRQRPGINNALDSLGDEGEIELDFSGFGNNGPVSRQQQAAYRTAEGASAASAAAESYTPRSKDAGKTCKERTNYASFDCAATVLKNNPECKSAPSVLVENKDSYMLNICSATNKFFIVELCNDILIDTIVLANYEFFSSIFRQFRVSVSDRYPVKMDRWTDLGTYEARNTREVQAFLIEQPQIWSRYLRIEFLSHYGGEYYCPVSLLRVHGTTMLEELRRPEEDASTGDGESADEADKAEHTVVPPIPEDSSSSMDHSGKITAPAEDRVEIPSSSTAVDTPHKTDSASAKDQAQSNGALSMGPKNTEKEVIKSAPSHQNDSPTCALNSSSPEREMPVQRTDGAQPSRATMSSAVTDVNGSENITASSDVSSSKIAGPSTSPTSETSSTAQQQPTEEASPTPYNETVNASINPPTVAANSSTSSIERNAKQSDTISSASQSGTNSTRATATSTSSISPPQPSTQESFFKSIQKRLTQLEANSTLSLQYIEEQSRILRDAFSKVEKRQISATTSFLSTLNETVMAELRGFRIAYDQIWQSTVLELEGQREQYQREILAISTRLTLVADELVWQKRMGIVQSTLVLLCLGLVLFARGGGGAHYLEVPLMQQMMNKSQTALSKATTHTEWDQSPPASPSPENRSPVSVFRRKLLWRSFTEPPSGNGVAGDSGTDSRPETRDGPPLPFGKHMVEVKVQPPTPERNWGLRRESTLEDEEAEEEEEGENGVEKVFEEVYEESAPSTPEVLRSKKLSDLLRVGVDGV